MEYDLIFQCPMDTAEYKKVDILNDLIELGYTAAFNPIPGFETYSADKKQLFKIGLLSLLNRPFYILHSGKFRCRLYGNDFSLREVSVLMGPYTAKGSGAICKAITYAADDKRKINLRLQEHSVCYLITDKSKVDIAGLVKGLGEYIINHMDCVWDFIYEVQT